MADQHDLIPAPKTPPSFGLPGRSIRDLLNEDKRALEDALTKPPKEMDDKRKDDLRDLFQQINPPVPGSWLNTSFQVAARPNALADILGRMSLSPVEQALQAARSFLSSVPVEQARVLEQAYLESLAERDREAARAKAFSNLVTPPAQYFDYSELDRMRSDLLDAERETLEAQADEEAETAMEIAREPFAGVPPALFSEESLTARGFKDAWGNPADDFAEPAPPASVRSTDGLSPLTDEDRAYIDNIRSILADEPGIHYTVPAPIAPAVLSAVMELESMPLAAPVPLSAAHAIASAAADEQAESERTAMEQARESALPQTSPAFTSPAPAPAAVASMPSFATPLGFAQLSAANAIEAQKQAENFANLSAFPDDRFSFASPRGAKALAEKSAFQTMISSTRDMVLRAEEARKAAEEKTHQLNAMADDLARADPLSAALGQAYSALSQAQLDSMFSNALESANISTNPAFSDPFGSPAIDGLGFGPGEDETNSAAVGALANTPAVAAASLNAMASILAGDPFGPFSDAVPAFGANTTTVTTSDVTGSMGSDSDDSDTKSETQIGAPLSTSVATVGESYAGTPDTTTTTTDAANTNSSTDGDGDGDGDGTSGQTGGLGGSLGTDATTSSAPDPGSTSDPAPSGDSATDSGGTGSAGGDGTGGGGPTGGDPTSDGGMGGIGGNDPGWRRGGRVKPKTKKKSKGLAARPYDY